MLYNWSEQKQQTAKWKCKFTLLHSTVDSGYGEVEIQRLPRTQSSAALMNTTLLGIILCWLAWIMWMVHFIVRKVNFAKMCRYESWIETFSLLRFMLLYVCRKWSVGVSDWEEPATASAFFSHHGNRQPSRPEGQSPDNEKKNTSPAMNNLPTHTHSQSHTVLRVNLAISIVHFSNDPHGHVIYCTPQFTYFAIISTLHQPCRP